jgi:uncharacterized membrane protein
MARLRPSAPLTATIEVVGTQAIHAGQGDYIMATVTVLKFATPDGAQGALGKIQELQSQHLINLHDAAIVAWPAGKKSPSTKQLVSLVSVGAVTGMFWGMLFGLIFITPLFGLAVGAAVGALGGAFRDYGIDDDFIKKIRSEVIEGTSALFLMTSDAVVDRVAEGMRGLKFEIIATNLSNDQAAKLREAFGVVGA